MRWEQGRAEIERLLEAKHLQQVPASREHADRLLAQARRHLASAASTAEDDPEGAYALLYDAARKALWAILENQGLRPTSSGGHLAAYNAVRAQLDPPMGRQLRPYDRMRRHRRDAEIPACGRAGAHPRGHRGRHPASGGDRRHRREGRRPDGPVLTENRWTLDHRAAQAYWIPANPSQLIDDVARAGRRGGAPASASGSVGSAH